MAMASSSSVNELIVTWCGTGPGASGAVTGGLRGFLEVGVVGAVEDRHGVAEVLGGGAVVEDEPARPSDDLDAVTAQYCAGPVDALVGVLGEEQVIRALGGESTQELPVGGGEVLALVDEHVVSARSAAL